MLKTSKMKVEFRFCFWAHPWRVGWLCWGTRACVCVSVRRLSPSRSSLGPSWSRDEQLIRQVLRRVQSDTSHSDSPEKSAFEKCESPGGGRASAIPFFHTPQHLARACPMYHEVDCLPGCCRWSPRVTRRCWWQHNVACLNLNLSGLNVVSPNCCMQKARFPTIRSWC